MQVILADPVVPWRYIELDASGADVDEQVQGVCAEERAAVGDLAEQPAFRVALIRTSADRYRFVLTNHHIVMDGWSLPILLQEIIAGYYGQRLPAAAPYRSFVSWLAAQDGAGAEVVWRELLAGFDTPTLVGPPERTGLGRRAVTSHRVSEQTTRALTELARAHHTTVNTVLQGAFAQLLCGLTGQHDVVSAPRSRGGPPNLPARSRWWGDDQHRAGARHPHRGHHHRRSARSTAKRPQPHPRPSAPGRFPRSTASPATTNCSTPCSSTRTTRSTPPPCPATTTWPSPRSPPRYNHYPLTVAAAPGTELNLRLEYDTDVFDAAGVEALVERLQRCWWR